LRDFDVGNIDFSSLCKNQPGDQDKGHIKKELGEVLFVMVLSSAATSHGGSVIKSDILIRDSYNKTSSKQILPSLTIFQETNPWIISKLHLNVEFIFGSKSNYVLYS